MLGRITGRIKTQQSMSPAFSLTAFSKLSRPESQWPGSQFVRSLGEEVGMLGPLVHSTTSYLALYRKVE